MVLIFLSVPILKLNCFHSNTFQSRFKNHRLLFLFIFLYFMAQIQQSQYQTLQEGPFRGPRKGEGRRKRTGKWYGDCCTPPKLQLWPPSPAFELIDLVVLEQFIAQLPEGNAPWVL
uniref:Uncharacterized protein n=1 Tax=Pygocentrus nattereri TaxID=42514 RepID=A0AAR2LNQ5_PYGNA